MKKVTIILLLILVGGCVQNRELKKKEITISYINVKKLTPNSWIKIDSHKFTHIKKYSIIDIDNKKNELPTKSIILQNIKGRELKESVNQIILLKILYRKLIKLDSNYYTSNFLSITAKGSLVLKRKDNKDINLQVSEGYPIAKQK